MFIIYLYSICITRASLLLYMGETKSFFAQKFLVPDFFSYFFFAKNLTNRLMGSIGTLSTLEKHIFSPLNCI